MQINFFPIRIPFDSYQINYSPYSIDKLKSLREQFNKTHSFFRNDDRIYISNKDGDVDYQIGESTTLNVVQNERVTSSLIKHIFFRTFKDRFPTYTPVDFYPFRFFSKQEKDDIIYSILPNNLKGKIAYKKLIEIQIRSIKSNGSIQFGFVINIKRNWIFNKTCLDLRNEGFNLIGLEVLKNEYLPGMQGVLEPEEEFIGIINRINGDVASVETNEGILEFTLSQLSIRKTKYNIGAYLSHSLSEQRSAEILQLIESKRHEIYNAQKLYGEILNIATSMFYEKSEAGEIMPISFQNKDSFCFTVEKEMLNASNSMELKTPTFIFDYAATKTNNKSPDMGLSNFGPYDSATFEPKSPIILCIGRKENRGAFSNFLASLVSGVPNSSYFKKGLLKKYEFQNIQLNIQDIHSWDMTEYLRVIKEADNQKPDLAIIEIPSEFKKYEDVLNPYYKIKAKLLQLEIPVQFVTSENIKKHNEYILNSIALQIYAKLGGTPWVLPSSRSVDREIIIGIGHSWFRNNAFKGSVQDRVVGITTFLSSDGQYLLSDKAKDVSFDEYFNELLKSLRSSIERLEKEHGWNEGDTVRLVFHIFKPIKNIEFEVVSELVKQFSKYRIQFAFVTISKTQPLKLFDTNQNGVAKYFGATSLKGAYIPDRATNIFIDSTTAIVQMLGAKELKSESFGMSNPIQIKIRTPQGDFENKEIEKLIFKDLSYIVQQIFSFTYLSWRNFLPGEQPATVLYSDLISMLLGKMRRVPGWDSDSLNYKLKRKKWFL